MRKWFRFMLLTILIIDSFFLFIKCLLENMAAVAQEVERLVHGPVGEQFDPPTLQSAC